MKNYFNILVLKQSFAVDGKQLHAFYVKAQQQFHPDRQIGKSEIEKQKAALASAEANDAYRILKDDYLRANHLLELAGLKVQGDHATIKPSPMVLMQAMEWNEEIEAGKSEPLAATLEETKTATLNQLSQEFLAEDYKKAAQTTLFLQYLNKALERVKRNVKGSL